ncbi:hypothetical protein DW083_12325 [Parabacteroides sp. AF48-14]|uniref:hypothetical protein n=1 Tax=Parabacteroides sp. AF48-14 TaxID=2292052 RepID=UPI000F006329|nr:hypothetical protein [Parabacteroides sp. AF48-14]RHO71133.1 hypothetical protein DW083_12325 [Parabacteroides sp. AF48-14]
MPIVIKEMHVRTVVERRIVTETEVSEEILRKIESYVVERLSAPKDRQSPTGRQTRRRNER